MIKSYTIYLPKDSSPQSIEKLIVHALKAIESEVKDTPIILTRFNLEHPFTADNLYGISYEFGHMTKEEIELRDENVEWTKEERISPDVKEIEFIANADALQKLTGMIVRLPQGMKQYDGVLLVKKFLSVINDLGEVNIHDFIYHDFSDEDAIRHPYFTLYYSK